MSKRIWISGALAVGAGALLAAALASRPGELADADRPAAVVDSVDRARARPPLAELPPEERLEEIPADEWLNGAPVSGADLRGQVVLVEFWTYLCYNCKNVEPWMKETWRELAPEGLRVVGVHTPEFAVEREVANVERYVRENGIGYPVAIDNGKRVWGRYNVTRAWPAFFVFDRAGRRVYARAGEGAVKGAREAIERALAEPAPAAASVPPERPLGVRVTARARRLSADRATLEVTLSAEPGHRVVRSPANEVWIDDSPVVEPVDGPVTLGDPFSGAGAGDVTYFDRPATARIEIPLRESTADRPVEISGRVVARACDDAEGICVTGTLPFAAPLPEGGIAARPAAR